MAIGIMVHGGAKTISPAERAAHLAGCRAAVVAGWEILSQGGSALAAVEAAIRVLEADPTFNAGHGATLNTAGQVELDAALFSSADLRWGAVGAVQGIPHPISLARKILETKPMLLVGPGAASFAAQHGLEQCDPAELITAAQRQHWLEQQARPNPTTKDTVGCVARDHEGVLVAGTSTGGTDGQLPGRVGDSPLLGCGLFVIVKQGACAMSGDGEAIIPVGVARTAVEYVQDGMHPDAAAEAAIAAFKQQVKGEAGCILIDQRGRVGWAHNSSDMACGYMTEELSVPVVHFRKASE